MIRAGLLLALLASPAAAQTAAPETSPEPVQRPTAGRAAEEVTTERTEEIAEADREGLRDKVRLSDADYATCLAALDDLGVSYTEIQPIVAPDDADCGILRPLSVTEVAPGVALSQAATLRCPAARAVAIWTRDFVLPMVDRLDDRGALTTIETGPGYVCRRRNGTSDGKLSEHGVGNAIDVLGFRFAEGDAIAVEPREAEGSIAEAFQDGVRAAACLDFTTVLGPGSNAAHDDHLHFDVIARDSGYRLCEQGGTPID